LHVRSGTGSQLFGSIGELDSSEDSKDKIFRNVSNSFQIVTILSMLLLGGFFTFPI